jgi:hypothetical protein
MTPAENQRLGTAHNAPIFRRIFVLRSPLQGNVVFKTILTSATDRTKETKRHRIIGRVEASFIGAELEAHREIPVASGRFKIVEASVFGT